MFMVIINRGSSKRCVVCVFAYYIYIYLYLYIYMCVCVCVFVCVGVGVCMRVCESVFDQGILTKVEGSVYSCPPN
jgi:hypothetical protein